MTEFDLCIVGGGFTGLGVGIEAQKQGMKCLLIEKESQLGTKASGNSLQIIHGGFRYLQSLDLQRVLESIRAQSDLKAKFPLYTETLPCILPLEGFPSLKSELPLSVASFMYDTLYRFISGSKERRTYTLSYSDSTKYAPYESYAPKGILLWHDVIMTQQDKIISALCDEFKLLGGSISSNTSIPSSDSKLLCYCNGVEDIDSPQSRWVMGCNVRLKKKVDFKVGTALKEKNRYFFAMPEHDHTHIGTWYFSREKMPSYEVLAPKKEELDSVINELNKSLGSNVYSYDDILSISWGMLPEGAPGSPLEKPYVVRKEKSLHCVTTKFTTFQTQAKVIVESLKDIHR